MIARNVFEVPKNVIRDHFGGEGGGGGATPLSIFHRNIYNSTGKMELTSAVKYHPIKRYHGHHEGREVRLVEMVTRGEWDQAHDNWLISHNPEDHPTEDDMPYYVPAGLRSQEEDLSWTLIEKWMSADLTFDTVKTSRLLPYAPPDEPF